MACCRDTEALGEDGVTAQIMAKFNHCRQTEKTSQHCSYRLGQTWFWFFAVNVLKLCLSVGSHLVEVELDGAAVVSVELFKDLCRGRWIAC